MAIDYSRLLTMQQPEALEYLRESYGSIGPITQTFGGSDVDPAQYAAPGYETGMLGYLQPTVRSMYGGGEGDYTVPTGLYEANITGSFDPEYAGGVYGHYVGTFDSEGNLRDVRFQKDERHGGWFNENLDWVGPLIVGGAMLAGSGLLSGLGTAGAETAVGAEILKDTAALDKLVLQAAAKDAALAAGLTPELAAAAGEVAGAYAGSSMSWEAAIQAGIDTATSGAATGLVNSAGTIVGGGGALTPGLTGVGGVGATATGLPALLDMGKELLKGVGLKQAIQAGLIAAPLLDKAFGSDKKGTVDAGYTNLVTPFTMTREVNPQAKPLTSQDAYAYLRGQPSPTTGQPVSTKQQNWFTDNFQRQESVNPVSGERFVTDPNTGRMYSSKELEELEKGTVNRAMGGGIAALAAGGGVGHLGGYSDGGQLLQGPGNGVSDSIPATIEGRQPARLANDEFVIPARIVSAIGEGSSSAGARELYAMMDRIEKSQRGVYSGGQIAKDTNARKHLPA